MFDVLVLVVLCLVFLWMSRRRNVILLMQTAVLCFGSNFDCVVPDLFWFWLCYA